MGLTSQTLSIAFIGHTLSIEEEVAKAIDDFETDKVVPFATTKLEWLGQSLTEDLDKAFANVRGGPEVPVLPTGVIRPDPPDGAVRSGMAMVAKRKAVIEQGQLDAERQVGLVFDMASDMPEVKHSRLRSFMLPELDSIPALVDDVSEYLQDIEAEAHVTCKDGKFLGDDGQAVVWPWERQGEKQSVARREQDPIDKLINLGLDASSAAGKRGRNLTGVRAWFSFAADEQVSPHRVLDPCAPLWAKLKEEWLLMRFTCALVMERGVQVNTAACYTSQAQGWHAKEHGIKIGGGLKMERLPAMLKGLRREIGEKPTKIRRGWTAQSLRKAMDMLLDPRKPAHANLRAALALAFQGLLRGEEFSMDGGHTWKSVDRLTRKDIAELTSERAVVMMHPCKNMKVLKGKTVPLVIGGGGKYIDAVAEIQNMLKVDPTAGMDPDGVPLFRDPASNTCITKQYVHELTKRLAIAVGENPDHFGTHSYRIGGATALFACGADPTVIRTMGRWSSDIYRLYVRACFERCCDWSKRAGSAVVTDVVVDYDEVEGY